jgi:hypothetical protein
LFATGFFAPFIVIPAQTGIQRAASAAQKTLDASLRWHDNIE